MTASGVYRPIRPAPGGPDHGHGESDGRRGGGDGSRRPPDLVVVGSASRDVVADDERGWRLGGAATYGSLAAARLGVRVGCLLGVDDLAADARELDLLREAGVQLVTVPLDSVPVVENVEREERREQRWLAAADPLNPERLPAHWRVAPGWMLGPIAGELPIAWAEVPPPGAFVSLGWQGLLRHFALDGTVHAVAPCVDPLVARAGLVCASRGDLPPDCEIASLRAIVPEPAVLVVTAGSHGGVVFAADGSRGYPAIPARPVDPTGAGDVFLAALTVGWLLGDEPAGPRSLRLAATAASCSVEGLGLFGVPTRAAIEERLLSI